MKNNIQIAKQSKVKTIIYLFQFAILYFVSMIFMNSGLDNASVLLAFTISISFFLVDKRLGFVSILVFAITLVLFNAIDPIGTGGDAANYYNYLLSIHDIGNTVSGIYDRVSAGYFVLIEVGGLFYYLPSVYLNSTDLFLLIFTNHMLYFIATILIAKVFIHTKMIEKKYFFVFILIVTLSPLVNKNISILLKESFIIFFLALSLYYFFVKKNIFILILGIIFASLARPYFLLIFIAYWFLISKKTSSKIYLIIILIETILLILYSGSYFDIVSFIKNTLLSFVATIAAPNFLRVENWTNNTMVTIESLVVFISYISLFFSKNKYKLLVFQSLIIYSLALGSMSMKQEYRMTYEGVGNEKGRNSLLKEDISRKKLPIMFINYYVVFLFYRRIRRTDYSNAQKTLS